MSSIFTPEQITTLSTEIDNQLRQLKQQPDSGQKGDKIYVGLVKQTQAIEKVTKEKPESFLKKFGRAAKQDLCEEGGLLNKQWKKWADLNNKDVLDKFGAVLVAMGFAGATLEILAVALAVIVIHIGVKAFCEEYGQ